MKSLIAIQYPDMKDDEGLGAFYLQPYEDDPNSMYGPNAAILRENQSLAAANAKLASSGSAVVTQSPEEMLDVSRKYAFLAATRPGFDYGTGTNKRNALFSRDSGLSGLSFDIFGAAVDSLKKNAPGAFANVKGGELISKVTAASGFTLPSWLPQINVPKPIQNAAADAMALAKKTAADVAAKQRADAAAKSSGVAAQTFGSPTPRNSKVSPWVIGGAFILATGAALAFVGKKK